MSDSNVQPADSLVAGDEPFGEGHPNLEFIKGRLPAWYLDASTELRQALRQSEQDSQFSERELKPIRKRLSSVHAFSEPLLVQALEQRFNLRLDVQRNQFVTLRIENSHLTGSHTVVRKQSLLQAALQNFEESEIRTGRFLLGAALLPVNGLQRVQLDEERLPDFPDVPLTRWKFVYNGRIDIKPEDFTFLCRSLDLGNKYQAHLDDVFKPVAAAGQTAAAAAQGVANTFMSSERDSFRVLTHIARMKKHISQSAHEMLVEWIKPDSHPLWNGVSVQHCTLQMLVSPSLPQQGLIGQLLNTPLLPANALFRDLVDSTAFPGSVLSGALLLEPVTGGGACLVYLPAEPEHPLKEYPSFSTFTNALRRKLASKSYQQYFQRFVDLRLSHLFFKKINDRLGTTTNANNNTFNEHADLELAKIVVAKPPFQMLYDQMLRKIYGDSRVLAVPTGDEDQASRLARILSYESHGLDLLNVAAFFIPVLGEVMAVVAFSQLLQEAFIGFQAWSHGETEEAHTHFFNIAENMALTAILVSAASTRAPTAPAPSAFVEGLTPVTLSNGSVRLWKPELRPFQQEVTLPAGAVADAEGRIEVEGKTWLPLEDKFYRIEFDPTLQKWRIRHPADTHYFLSPVLERSAAGRWRHTGENPMAWEAQTLFRRLHGSLGHVSEQTAERVMAVTGADEAVLRQVHVENLELPALLHDSLQRFQVGQIIDPPLNNPHVLLIQRDFPGLPTSVANEILQSASSAEKARMTTANRLPLRLAEQAREYQQILRLNRANEGFYQQDASNLDTATAGFQMLENLPGWPRELALEIRENSVTGERLAGIGGQEASVRQVVVKSASGYQAFDSAGIALGQPGQGFFTALLQALPDTTRTAVGLSKDASEQALRVMLGNVAVKRRDLVARSLGMQPIKPGFKSPSRLEDGRVGYPLSGRIRGLFARLGRRGFGYSPELAVKELFPSYHEVEVQAFLDQIRAEHSGGSSGVKAYVQQRLQALETERDLLAQTLDNWVVEGDGERLSGGNISVITQADKQIAAIRIKKCWRRQGERRYLVSGEFIGFELNLSGLAVGQLPPFTARFDHVGSLVVNSVGMTSAEAHTLLGQFNNLRWLSLSGNGLTFIPEGLTGQTRLVRLSLQNNPLRLDEVSVQRLGNLTELQALNLSQCPIGSLLDFSGFSRLSRLSLRATGIDRVPAGLMESEALVHTDLRDNHITDLSVAFVQSMSSNIRRFQLHDNPISAQSLERAQQLLSDRTRMQMGLSTVRTHARSAVNNGSLWMTGIASHQYRPHLLKWGDLQAEPHSSDFFHVLDDLTQSADYRNNKLVLTRRVWAVIDEVSRSAALREELFAMTEHPETCGDGAAIIFNNMEVQVLLFKAMGGLQARDVGAQRGALFSLARGLDRLDEVERIAQGDITRRLAANERPDQAEVRLAYRVGLARRLELPEQPQGMLFERLSGVSSRMLDIAEQWIREREGRPEFLQSIIAREFWMTFLERHYTARFESVQAPFYERLETLDAERETITDEAYLSQVEDIRQARLSAVDALALELTQAIKQEVIPVEGSMPPVEI